MTVKPASYLVCGQRPWCRRVYDEVISRLDGDWNYSESRDIFPPPIFYSSGGNVPPNFRYIFFLHWSDRAPAEIIDNYECINFHMTALPYGRGGSPLQNLILRGHTDTILTAHRMTREIDAGPIYLQKPLSLVGSAEEIYLRVMYLAAGMIKEIVDTNPKPVPQPTSPKELDFKRREPIDSWITETVSLGEFYDKIRMVDADGYPKAFITLKDDFKIEFSNANLYTDRIECRAVIRRTT